MGGTLLLNTIDAQVQIQASGGLDEFGLNALMQKTLSKNQKFNYYGHSNFELKYENDSTGTSEFFHVVDYKLHKNIGLALGHSINQGEFAPEFGFAFSYEKKSFDFAIYPTVNYAVKAQALGFGANGMMSFTPKLKNKWNLYSLLIFGLDFTSDFDYTGNQSLMLGLEYNQLINFGLSGNLSTSRNATDPSLGLFVGMKLFNDKNFESADLSSFGGTEEPADQNSAPKNYVVEYNMPEESEPHEGTWLQWPHHYQYGEEFRKRLDPTWVAMTKALQENEKVHLIAYDEKEKVRIQKLLADEKVPTSNIDFRIHKTDDFWARDNGPIYAKDSKGQLVIQDWGFNGWGGKADFENCDVIPAKIAAEQGKKLVDLNKALINEGGSVELDGHGTLLACRSSILNKNRNPGVNQAKAEEIFAKYLGATNFIWLDGVAGLEITDMHIDGFARFDGEGTIVTMSKGDLSEWDVPAHDIERLYRAKNKKGKPYNFVQLPLTQENVKTTYGKTLDHKGTYVNYYIANNVVLVPMYNDPNDKVAMSILQKIYPTRKMVGIDVRNLSANGGMIHCVTQQQPK